MVPWPRVHPLLMTLRRSAFLASASSASSMMKEGCHFVIERNSAAPLISTLCNERHAKKFKTPSNVVLPLLGSTDVTSKIGLCVTTLDCSCSHENTIHSVTATA